jgi:hypothetical protein
MRFAREKSVFAIALFDVDYAIRSKSALAASKQKTGLYY